jgi:hypothetical protein
VIGSHAFRFRIFSFFLLWEGAFNSLYCRFFQGFCLLVGIFRQAVVVDFLEFVLQFFYVFSPDDAFVQYPVAVQLQEEKRGFFQVYLPCRGVE